MAATDNDVDGRVTGATNKDIMAAIWEKGASWRLADNAGDLASRPLFIAIAARDGDNCKALALSRALKDAGAAKTRMVTFDTDHGFNDHRVALEVSVLGWLTTLPGAPPLE